MNLQLRQPVPDVQERLLIGDVEDENEAHGVAEERGGERAEALLASSVPQLQKDSLATTTEASTGAFVDLEGMLRDSAVGRTYNFLLLEVNSDCRDELASERVVSVAVLQRILTSRGTPKSRGTHQKRRLPDSRIAQCKELDEIVVVAHLLKNLRGITGKYVCI